MNPKLYEGFAAQHIADMHRDAAGSQAVARARGVHHVGDAPSRPRSLQGVDRVAAIIGAVRAFGLQGGQPAHQRRRDLERVDDHVRQAG